MSRLPSRSLARALVAAAALLLSGCFIPWRQRYLLLPGGRITVVEYGSGAPIAGATVHVHRDELPHLYAVESFEASTDERGVAAFARRTRVETVFPLWMHGVHQNLFRVCAEAQGRAPRMFNWRATTDADSDLLLALPPGDGRCQRLPWAEPAPRPVTPPPVTPPPVTPPR